MNFKNYIIIALACLIPVSMTIVYADPAIFYDGLGSCDAYSGAFAIQCIGINTNHHDMQQILAQLQLINSHGIKCTK